MGSPAHRGLPAYLPGGIPPAVLTAADLEVNVLEFRHRAFQFERVVDLEGEPFAVFYRTETESERQLRPKLVRLRLVVPLGWVVLDASSDLLRVARNGAVAPARDGDAVEVAAEPSEFTEDGIGWRRQALGTDGYLYVPAELAARLLTPGGRAALGVR